MAVYFDRVRDVVCVGLKSVLLQWPFFPRPRQGEKMDTPEGGGGSPQPLQSDVGSCVPTQALERDEKTNVDDALPSEGSMECSSVEHNANAANTSAAGTPPQALSM